MLKIPGLILAGIWLLALVAGTVDISKKWALAVITAAALGIVVALTIGFELNGAVTLSWQRIELPYVGSYAIQFHNVSSQIAETTLSMINWNLLFYLVIPALIFATVHLVKPTPRIISSHVGTALIMTLLFLILVYFFTERYKFAADFTQVNRALLYAVPLMIYWLSHLIYANSGRRTSRYGNSNTVQG